MRASLNRPFIFLTDEEREKNVKETHLKGTVNLCYQISKAHGLFVVAYKL